MTVVSALLFDGQTSRAREVQVRLELDGCLFIEETGVQRCFSLAQLRVADRLGNTPRAIYLPDEAKLELTDNDAVDAFLKISRGVPGAGFVHGLESKWRIVLLSMVGIIAFTWGLVQFGIPSAAKQVAFALPASTDEMLGQQTLQIMDKAFLERTELDTAVQQRLVDRFEQVVQQVEDDHQFRLLFRKSDMVGANAFALPSGIVVMTDGLVELSENDDELASVLAHEVGHVVERHALRSVLQNSVTVLLIAIITGDIASVSSLAAALPTLLVEAQYSRQFEAEADRYAFDYLKQQDIAAVHFINILSRLHKDEGPQRHNYFSSHPATSERIKIFKLLEAP